MSDEKIYRIHPSIGIARMGRSNEFFVGPEASTLSFVPSSDGKYRDSNGELRRQAQQFRIYEFTYSEGSEVPQAVREITTDEADIKWSVHVVNTKSFQDSEAQRIPIDPDPQTLESNDDDAEAEGEIWGTNVRLASLRRDGFGRLLVLGSLGKTGRLLNSPMDELRNKGWWDDAGDGPVRAWLNFNDDRGEVEVQSAWVVVSLPAYAAPILNTVTLYDLALEHANRATWLPKPATPSFTDDIFPILFRAVDLQWTSKKARRGHASGGGNFLDHVSELADVSSSSQSRRHDIWKKLRSSGGNMPPLRGLSLTSLQYKIMTDWKDGNFRPDWSGMPHFPCFDDIPVQFQPNALDRAALESMCGGSFNPGIEVCKVVDQHATWGAPFRVASEHEQIKPGDLTRDLAVPWQADFKLCGTGWWPASRPNSVSRDGRHFHSWLDMTASELLDKWPDLGFLKRRNTGQVLEDERRLP